MSGQGDTVGNAVGAPSTTSVGPWANVFVPVLFHPTSHFFLGVGPRLVHRFADATGSPSGASAQSTTLEAAFVLGGTFGGEPSVQDGSPAASTPDLPARLRRFGDSGTFVITGETDAYANGTSYAGTPSSSSGIYVRPGFDVFLADHFSLGLDVTVGHSHGVSLAATGAQVAYDSTSFGVAPRFGLEIPLGEWLSLYPRAEIGFGSLSQNESSSGVSNDHTSTELWVSLEAPLLVHVARHFFAGMGPWVTHDLDNTDQSGYTNLGTSIGVSALLGGWM